MTTTFAFVRRESVAGVGGHAIAATARADAVVEEWRQYLDGGHRIGPADAKVLLLVFADFECPMCRAFERGSLRAIRQKYPTDVAVMYRHWPLSYHRFAYPAARAAECAASQGRFEPMHDLLYEKQDSLGLKSFLSFAIDAGVADTSAFSRCTSARGTVPSIDADSAAARAIGGRGTPTIVIGGVRLGAPPDSATLDRLVQRELSRAGSTPH